MRNYSVKMWSSSKKAWMLVLFLGFYCIVGANERPMVHNGTIESVGDWQFTVNGKVVDQEGIPIPGVSVIVKGTSVGVATDFDGNYSIETNEGDVLQFSYLGYSTKEVTIDGNTNVDVVLQEDVSKLDEVVVVGYGSQKKSNLTGSTAVVKSEELMKRPVSNSAAMLQGRVAGLNIVQNSGQPGAEGVRIRLRGVGSFGDNSPYVLIDGVPGNINSINPSDIEDMVVLKDAASASIYGSLGANGVILITTKGGKRNQAAKLEVSTSIGFQEASKLPDFIYDSVEYMEAYNRGAAHTGVSQVYPQEVIEAYRNADPNDPRFPNFNWLDHIVGTGYIHNHQLSLTGGGEKNSYYLNFGVIDQEGIIDRYGSKKYSARANIDVDVSKSLSMGFRGSMTYTDRDEPVQSSIYEMMLYVYTMPPTMSPYLADGSGRFSARDIPDIWRNRNPQMILDSPGFTRNNDYVFNSQAYMDFHPFDGFSWKNTIAWRHSQNDFKRVYSTEDGYVFSNNEFFGEYEGVGRGKGVEDSRSGWNRLTFNSVATYQKSIAEDHNFTVLAGYEQQEENYGTLWGYRPDLPSITTTDLNAASAEGQQLSGSSYECSLQSLFGRLNYDFKGEYLIEGSLRYDGHSRLHPDHRWTFFTSASAGWRVSEESFMDNVNWIDNLKVRASYGELGNVNSLGNYPYQRLLSTTSYPIGGGLQPGVFQESLSNSELTWETLKSINLGLDFSMKNGLFGFELDLYKKITSDGHDTAQIPASVGKLAPTVNFQEMENKGIDLVLRHRNNVGKVFYDMNFTVDAYKNEITKRKENSWGRNSRVEGHPINEFYMLDWIGIYQNQEQVDNLPIYEPYRNQTQPGDLIFRDVNGDGEITLDDEGAGDEVFIQGQHPKFSYSYNLNVEYKNFDFSMFWQGIAGKKDWYSWIGYEPFMQGGPLLSKWRNAWNGEGSTNSMPAIYNLAQIYGYNPVTGVNSDFRLQNTSYLRLKNIQIGYTLPTEITEKFGMQKVRFFATGDNLLTFTKFEFDPERDTNSNTFSANSFPQLRTITFGANLTF
jgi:TonB-linked SusC/RagA family outer membrane protein